MANTIKLKTGSGSDPSASDLIVGEIAIRTDSGKLFTKKDNGTVAEISGGGGIDDGDKGDITVSNGGDTFTIDSGVVTSAKIADGTIVNADINASAAIAGSKISPTFTSNFTATGTEHKFTSGASGDCKLIIEADSDNNNEADNPLIALRQDGGIDVSAIGHNFSGSSSSGNELFISNSVSNGGIVFYTGATNGYTNGTERLRIASGGQITGTGNLTLTSTDTGSSAAPEFELYRNSASPADADYLGQLKFTGESDDGSKEVYAKVTGKISDASSGTEDGLIEFALRKAGSNNIGARLTSTDLKLINGTGLEVAGNISCDGTVDGVDIAARDTLFGGLTSSSGVLTNGVTATTQSAGDNSTKVATTAYTDTAISNLVDSSPSALNTLNELAAALGDDANFSTTVTNSIATKLPLAGGTLTGNVKHNDNVKALFGSGSDLEIFHNGNHSKIINKTGNLTLNSAATTGAVNIIGSTGQVELFYGGAEKLETTNTGINVSGNITLSGTVDGRDIATDGTKLDTIESNATADQTASEILTLIKTVDGAGSGLDADTLDGISSASFLRSDADDSTTGLLTLARTSDEHLILSGSLYPYIRFQEGTTNKAYIQWHADGYFRLVNQEDSSQLRIQDDIKFSQDGSTFHSIFHEGNLTVGDGGLTQNNFTNTLKSKLDGIESGATADQTASEILTLIKTVDGAGSGLDADTLDGVSSASFLRSDANDTSSGTIAFGTGALDPDSFASHSGGFGNIQDGGGWAAKGVFVHGGGTGDAAAIAHNGSKLYFGIQNGSAAHSMTTWLDVTPSSRIINFQTADNANNVRIGGNKIFHAGNDGSGSGLDSDLLDGQEGSYYRNASNLNSGTIGTARIADDAVTIAKLNLISTSSAPALEAKGDGSSQDGYIQLNCSQNSHGIKLASPAHSAGASYTFTFPTSISSGQFLTVDSNGNTSWATPTDTNTQLSNSQVRAAVEAASDSNVFTDADHSKLNGIEASATADQTASEILTLIKTVDGAGSGLDADTLDGVSSASFLRSDADDSFTGTITANSDITNPVIKVQGSGPNFIQFASDASGTVDADSINFIYRTSPNTLGFERASDATSLFTVDADDGQATFSGNLDVGAGLDVTGNISVSGTVDGRDVASDGSKLDGIESGATADQTNAEIKTAYEANSNTNAFTDALLSKLNGIAASATNVTNNNQLTNGAGYITSAALAGAADGGNAALLDGIDSTQFLRADQDDTTTGNLTISNAAPQLFLTDTNANSDYAIVVNGGEFRLRDETNSANRFVLNSSGNISVGGTITSTFSGNLTGNVSGSSGSCAGNAATATKLATARTIAGVSFDGSANISLNNNAITNGAGYITSSGTSAACSGNAATATRLQTARTIAGVSFNGTANISLNNNAITNGAGYVTSSIINSLNASNLSSGTIPDARFPSTLPAIDGSNLTGISAGATGGGSDEVFYENDQTVTTNYTITNGKNAMAAGPITINSGVTVTVGSGETLTIV